MRQVILLLSICFVGTNSFAQSFDANRVVTFFQNDQYDEAINYIKPYLASDSNNIQLLGYLAHAYNATEKTSTAAAYYSRIVSIDSTNVPANHNLANIYMNKNDSIAIMLTGRLMRLQPARSLYYRNMGSLVERRKEKDSAVTFFQEAYRLDPHDLRNISALADILIDTRRYPEADSILQLGMSIDSMYIPLLISGVRSAYENDRFEEAVTFGERLIQQQDVTIKPLTLVVLSYYHLKKYKECITACEYLRAQEIETEGLKYYEAKAWSKLENFERSNELLRECLESAISERAELYFYALADNYEETGNFSKAIATYDTAYYLFKSPLVKYNVGRIYQTKLNNPTMAGKYFKKYLYIADTSNPEEKKAYYYLIERNKKK